jgi:hypothetical protein
VADQENDLDKAFRFFELDGAFFRRKAGKVSTTVDEILHEGKWKPYTGDRSRPAAIGNIILAKDVPKS